LIDEYAAVSKENYPPPFCIDEPITIWVEGELKFDGVKLIPIWDDVEPFIRVTLDLCGRLCNYFCWRENLYGIYGISQYKALNAIKYRREEFYAFAIGDTNKVVYSWGDGDVWYLVYPAYVKG